MADVEMEFALHVKSKEPIHVSNADNGLACGCVCFDCGDRVAAKQGKIKQWHFSHVGLPDGLRPCSGEDVRHKAAKRILAKCKTLRIGENETVRIKSVQLEKKIPGTARIADALVQTDKGLVVVEFFQTHKKDEAWREEVFAQGIQSIEIQIDWEKVTNENKLEGLVASQARRWELTPGSTCSDCQGYMPLWASKRCSDCADAYYEKQRKEQEKVRKRLEKEREKKEAEQAEWEYQESLRIQKEEEQKREKERKNRIMRERAWQVYQDEQKRKRQEQEKKKKEKEEIENQWLEILNNQRGRALLAEHLARTQPETVPAKNWYSGYSGLLKAQRQTSLIGDCLHYARIGKHDAYVSWPSGPFYIDFKAYPPKSIIHNIRQP